MNILHVDSSITGDASASRQLSAAIVQALAEGAPGARIIRRDLEADPVPHLNGRLLAALGRGTDGAGPEVREQAQKDAAALEEFMAADVVVIGAPMYNFSVPSQLKAWLDRLFIAGRTFRYTAQGSEGLAGGRTVIIASSRGGLYGPDAPNAAADFQEPFLRALFGLMGVTDVRFVRAEGLALGPESREAALAAALAEAAAVAAQTAPALAA